MEQVLDRFIQLLDAYEADQNFDYRVIEQLQEKAVDQLIAENIIDERPTTWLTMDEFLLFERTNKLVIEDCEECQLNGEHSDDHYCIRVLNYPMTMTSYMYRSQM